MNGPRLTHMSWLDLQPLCPCFVTLQNEALADMQLIIS